MNKPFPWFQIVVSSVLTVGVAFMLAYANSMGNWVKAEWEDTKKDAVSRYAEPTMKAIDQLVRKQNELVSAVTELSINQPTHALPDAEIIAELKREYEANRSDREHFRKQMRAFLLKSRDVATPAASPAPTPSGGDRPEGAGSGVVIGPDFVRAIHLVETGGRLGPIRGAAGELGPLQITEAEWKDAKQYDPDVCDTFAEVADFKKAEKVLIAYLSRWGEHFHKQHGVWPDYLTLAQIWNGGPRGYAKKSTLRYAYEFALRIERTRDWWHAKRPKGGDPLLEALQHAKSEQEFQNWYRRTHPDRTGVHRVGREGRGPEVGP